MLNIVQGDIFDTKCQALVCPVNTVGVMGAGLAKQFATRFPESLHVYRDIGIKLSKNIQRGGDIYFDDSTIWHPDTNSQYIIYFATKEDFRYGARLDWIERGLQKFVASAPTYEIKSAAFPMLGCGLGGLHKLDVLELLEKYFKNTQYDIEVYDK